MIDFFDLFETVFPSKTELCCDHLCVWVETEEYFVCEICGVCKDRSAPSTPPMLEYKKGCSVYSRNTHFRSWLVQLQGKDNYRIPDSLWQVLQTVTKPSITEIRRVLKEHKASKFYKAVPFILAKLTNRKPPKFSYSDQTKLEHYFQQVTHSYDKVKGPGRKNLLRYAYVLYKLCQMLGFHDFLDYLPLPKLKTKLAENEKVWQRICEHRGWTFYSLSS